MKVLRAPWVVPVTADPVPDGAVAVDNGVIAAVGSARDVYQAFPDAAVEDLGDAILIPGLIDVHCHLEWALVGGLYSGADGFAAWIGRLLSLWPIPDGMLPAAARLAALRALCAGTTTLMDNGPTGAGVAALTESGQRGIVHLEAFGGDPAVAGERAQATAEGIAALSAQAGERVGVGVSPHAPYSAGPALWDALRAALGPGVSWSTHIAESRDERDAVAGHGDALAAAFGPRGISVAHWPGAGDGSSVRALDRAGALHDGLLAAHVVHVDDEDIALLAARGVRAAHCPISNATLRCGRSPVERLQAAGVVVALGTDSPSSAGTYDLRAEARACAATHAGVGEHFAPADLLRMCTADAARAIGRDHDLGKLTPGARADVVALRPPVQAWPGNPYAAAMDAATVVTDVWVDGERLLRGGLVTRVDAAEIDARAYEMRQAVC